MTDLVPPIPHGDISSSLPALLSSTTRTGHTVAALIAAWLGSKTESAATRDAYRRDLRHYLDWCTQRGLDPLAVRLPEVTMYAVALADTPLSAKTRARRLASVSSWYRFLVRAGVLDANPAADVERPRYDRRHSPTSSVNQAEATTMKARAGQSADLHRGRAPAIGPDCAALAMALLIDLGIRVSEACGADTADLGQRDGQRVITVRMKGGKVRTRPIPVQLAPILDAYLANRPAGMDEDAERALLRTRDGHRVTRHQVYGLVQRAAAAAGVSAPHSITPHSMRHTWNTVARLAGAAVEARRDALGHSSVAITEIYDHAAQSISDDPAHLVAAATDPTCGAAHRRKD